MILGRLAVVFFVAQLPFAAIASSENSTAGENVDEAYISNIKEMLEEESEQSAAVEATLDMLKRHGKARTTDAVLQLLYNVSPVGQADQPAIDLKATKEQAAFRARQVSDVLVYDLNADGQITRDEAAKFYDRQRISVEKVFELSDSDNDGVVSFQEMLDAPIPSKRHQRKSSAIERNLLVLDVGMDGVTSAEDIIQALVLLHTAFVQPQ